jgi:hypothetical protein
MIRTSRHVFEQVVAWLRETNNYAGVGRHEVDATTHYMKVGGESKAAACQTWDDFGGGEEIWLVDKEVLRQWREKFGYTIEF